MGWLSGWSYRKKITIESAYVDGNLSNFPLYVPISGDTDIGGNISDSTNGYDIRFTDADEETLLKYERLYFNVAAGSATAYYFVKVPTIYASPTGTQNEIYVYYNDGSGSSDGQDAANVWDGNFVAVYHMDETSGDCLDSKQNLDGTYGGALPTQTSGAGAFYKAQDFVSTNPDVVTLAHNELDIAQNLSAEVWVEYASQDVNEYALGKATGHMRMGQNTGGAGKWDQDLYVDGTLHDYSGPATTTGWHYLCITYDGSNIRHYVDGAKLNTSPDTGNIDNYTNDFIIGNQGDGSFDSNQNICEVRISQTTVRSDDWIKFVWYNQSETGNEVSFGSETSGFTPKIIII